MKEFMMDIQRITIPFDYKKGDSIIHEKIFEGWVDRYWGIDRVSEEFEKLREEAFDVDLIANEKKIFGFIFLGETIFYVIKNHSESHKVGDIWSSKSFQFKGVWGA